MNRKFLIVLLFIFCIIFTICGLVGLTYEKPVKNPEQIQLPSDNPEVEADILKIAKNIEKTHIFNEIIKTHEIVISANEKSITIEYGNKSNTERKTLVFDYVGGVLSCVTTEKDDVIVDIYKSVINAKAIYDNYDIMDAHFAVNLLDLSKTSIVNEGIVLNDLEDKKEVSISVDTKLILPSLVNSELLIKDFIDYKEILQDPTKYMFMEKGKVKFASLANTYYFYEYDGNTDVTLNSVVNFIELYFGDTEFRNKYTSLQEYDDGKIKISQSIQLSDQDKIMVEETNGYGYYLVKVEIPAATP